MIKKTHPASNIDGNANHHGGKNDPSCQCDANRSPNQRPHLPHDLLLPTPRFLAPEGTARRTGRKQRIPTDI